MNSENSSRFFSYAGSGGRTIKIDVLSSKPHHKLTKERRNNAALLAYAQFVFLTFRKKTVTKSVTRITLEPS